MSEAGTKAGGLSWLNALPERHAEEEFSRCCGASSWARAMAKGRPFSSEQAVHQAADSIWSTASDDDILEALRHHPKIGTLENLREKFASTSEWAQSEQSGVRQAADSVLIDLQQGNEEYEQKFGFIFVVFATGKTAGEMLAILRERLPHERAQELRIASEEQRKITHNRLEKLWQQQQR